jgi:hypothetical protein
MKHAELVRFWLCVIAIACLIASAGIALTLLSSR